MKHSHNVIFTMVLVSLICAMTLGADSPRRRSRDLETCELTAPVKTIDLTAVIASGVRKGNVRQLFRFDSADRLLEQTQLDSDGAIQQRSVWNFDTGGVRANKLVYDDSGALDEKVIYEHDGSGNIVAETTYTADDERRDKQKHTYDARGRLIKSEVLDTDDNDAVYRIITYEYDSKDRVVKVRQAFTERGFAIGGPMAYDIAKARRLNVDLRAIEHVYEYDDHDNIATDTWLSGETVIQRTSRDYKYDGHGNWIEKVEKVVVSNGLYPERSETAKRTLTYK